MSREFAEMLYQRFNLSEDEYAMLQKNISQLDRRDRRYYFGQIKTKENEFKQYLKEKANILSDEELNNWIRITSRSMLDRGGDPDLADCMVMDILGRLRVYQNLRELAEKEGVRLKAMNNFGGLSMVLTLIVILSGLAAYLFYR
jgi:energy-converting hydrogenase A subunit M